MMFMNELPELSQKPVVERRRHALLSRNLKTPEGVQVILGLLGSAFWLGIGGRTACKQQKHTKTIGNIQEHTKTIGNIQPFGDHFTVGVGKLWHFQNR